MDDPRVHVLLLEDDRGDAELVTEFLSESRDPLFQVTVTERLQSAMAHLSGEMPAVILTDLNVTDSKGPETFRVLHAMAPNIPIVVLTGELDDDRDAVSAVRKGAADYLVKGQFGPPALIRALRYAIERKRAEQQLVESEQRFRAVVESAKDAIISANREGLIVAWNGGARAMFGYLEAEVLGTPITSIMPERFREPHQEAFERFSQTGDARTVSGNLGLTGLTKDGAEFPLTISVSKWETREGVFSTAIIRDITELKLAEHQLKEANAMLVGKEKELRVALDSLTLSHEELQAAQLRLIDLAKVESVSRLAAGVAHEIKNPLAIVLAGLDCLQGSMSESDRQKTLGMMTDSVKKADKVIMGLLEYSAPKALDLKRGDLNSMVEPSLALVKHDLDKAHIKVERALGPDVPQFAFDRNKIEQLLVNIFMNSIQAMPRGGVLTIRTSGHVFTTQDDVERAVPDSFRAGEAVVIVEVEDSGTGIPESSLNKIFDPFFTTKPTGRGTGLGLTVIKTVMNLHEGVVEVRNRAEGGVRVRLIFRLEARPAKTAEASPRELAAVLAGPGNKAS